MDFNQAATAKKLKSYIERIENLENDKAHVLEGLKEVFSEAKSEGFSPKIMRHVLKIRKMKTEDLAEQEQLVDLYLQAINLKDHLSPQ